MPEPAERLEAIADTVSATAEDITARLKQIVVNGPNEQDVEWMGRISDALETIYHHADTVFGAINETPVAARDDPPAPGNLSPTAKLLLEFFLTHENYRIEEIRKDDERFADVSADEFRKLRSELVEHLAAYKIEADWATEGRQRGKRYTLQLIAGKTALEAALRGEEPEYEQPTPETSAADEPSAEGNTPPAEPPDSQTMPSPAPQPKGGSETLPELPDPEEDTEQPKMITIRGKVHYFSKLEYAIVQSLLDGPLNQRAIITAVTGESYADPEWYRGDFIPALRHLEQTSFGDVSLVSAFMVEHEGQQFQRLRLPDGARIDRDKKTGEETLRFTDSSSHTPNPDKSQKPPSRRRVKSGPNGFSARPPNGPATPPAPAPKPPPGDAHVSSAVLTEDGLLVSKSGEGIEVEPQVKKIITVLQEAAKDGERLTVSEIAVRVNPDSNGDQTFNSIIADELMRLQQALGTETLRRKQKKGQQARWWLTS